MLELARLRYEAGLATAVDTVTAQGALAEAEVANPDCTSLSIVETMHERTQAFTDLSDGFLTLPGGVGTPGSMGAEGPAPTGPGIRRPLLGFCEPRDIASAVLYFATPAARFVTNQTLAVDAGFSIC